MYCKYFAYDGTIFDSEEECKEYESTSIPNKLVEINARINCLTSKSYYGNCKEAFNRVEECKRRFIKELYHQHKTWLGRAQAMCAISNSLLNAINNYNKVLNELHKKRKEFNYLKTLEDK